MSSLFDSVMSDTVGVVYRAASGNVDPWTQAEIQDQEAQQIQQASAGAVDPTAAAEQAASDVSDTLHSFTLGGDDRTGAAGFELSIPSGAAVSDTIKSATNDNGSGCGITNLAGCFHVPTWAIVAAVGLVVLVAGGYLIHVGAEAKSIVA